MPSRQRLQRLRSTDGTSALPAVVATTVTSAVTTTAITNTSVTTGVAGRRLHQHVRVRSQWQLRRWRERSGQTAIA